MPVAENRVASMAASYSALVAEPVRVKVRVPSAVAVAGTVATMAPNVPEKDRLSPTFALVSTMVAEAMLALSRSVTAESMSAIAAEVPPTRKLPL